jgi:hypothetical protein
MASPVADKPALFADRFRARADVYAVRWENTRTGAAGWMPAAGAWKAARPAGAAGQADADGAPIRTGTTPESTSHTP